MNCCKLWAKWCHVWAMVKAGKDLRQQALLNGKCNVLAEDCPTRFCVGSDPDCKVLPWLNWWVSVWIHDNIDNSRPVNPRPPGDEPWLNM